MSNLRSKKFLEFLPLQSTLDSEFLREGSVHQLFLVTAKFEVKNFSEFFPLPSAVVSQFSLAWGGSAHQLFLVTLNLRSKCFENFFLYYVLWTLNLSGDVQAPIFFGHAKFEVQIFSEFFLLLSTLNWIFWKEGSRYQIFLVTPNLRPKIFQNFFLN